ncbi:MAG: hypothetical protein M0R37_12285, partial [Bacteroidales bacterium]|nr:hypothetical protein [Bacteroidales bacterium]
MTENELTEALSVIFRASTEEPLASAVVHSYQQERYDTSKDVLVTGWIVEGEVLDLAIGGQGRTIITVKPRALLFSSTVDTIAGQRAPGLMAEAIRKILVTAANRSITAGGDTAERNSNITWVHGYDEIDERQVQA